MGRSITIPKRRTNSPWFHPHAHSKFSVLDGMPSVKDMVDVVVRNRQPGLVLSDHGNMSGVAQLYKACRKADIIPFPGEEFYVVSNVDDKEAERHHMVMFALNLNGYQALVRLSSRSHERDRFHRKPRIDLSDLAELSRVARDDIAVTTGCYFGFVPQAIVKAKGGTRNAIKRAKYLAGLFTYTFVEIQHHNTFTANEIDDDSMVRLLWDVAFATGIPVLVTQDAHYCEMSHKAQHDLMKRVGYYGASSDDSEKDWTFPGDSYHLADTDWVQSHYEEWPSIWSEAEDSARTLLEANELRIPPLDKYAYYIPEIRKDAESYIKRRCWTSLTVLDINDKRYKDRLVYELDVIETLGFFDYFVLACEIVDFCKERGIRIAARGSASGSIVCWLIGATQLDPIEYKLMFERFLSLDRERPPDIDFDIDKFRRDEVIGFIESKHQCIPIGTYGTLGQDEETGKGSMFVLFMQHERQRLGKEEFDKQYRDIKSMADLDRATQRRLYALADHNVYKHHATHAAGLLVTDENYPITDYVPTMLVASKGHSVTQMTMDDVEDLGFVKVDLLGLRAEFTVARTLELIGESPVDDMSWVPLDDHDTFMAMRRGSTSSGIFTFEGYTQANGAKEVRVKSIDDLTLVNALYRPATINSGYVRRYLKRKNGEEEADYLDGPGGLFEQSFGSTYGIPVYQEQVLTLLRLLGFPQHELNQMLKAIKASNKKIEAAGKTFDETEVKFKELCSDAGFTRKQSNDAWEAILQFSDYSFNKAHAAEYAVRGYMTAYLKVHYPLEFHTALLQGVAMSGGETQKRLEPAYSKEARACGIRLLQPDISISGEWWTVDRKSNAIRRGLTSIKGVGGAVADAIVHGREKHKPTDLVGYLEAAKEVGGRAVSGGNDYIKTGNFSGVVKALRDAGALRSLGIDREDD